MLNIYDFPPPYSLLFTKGDRASGVVDTYQIMDAIGQIVVTIPTYKHQAISDYLALTVDALNVAFKEGVPQDEGKSTPAKVSRSSGASTRRMSSVSIPSTPPSLESDATAVPDSSTKPKPNGTDTGENAPDVSLAGSPEPGKPSSGAITPQESTSPPTDSTSGADTGSGSDDLGKSSTSSPDSAFTPITDSCSASVDSSTAPVSDSSALQEPKE